MKPDNGIEWSVTSKDGGHDTYKIIIDINVPKRPEQDIIRDAMREALDECCDILELPGSPTLTSIPDILREMKNDGRLRL